MAATVPTSLQRQFWNEWNASHRENTIQDVSERQAEVILAWLDRLCAKNLDILEVGCGAGWFCPQLARFGKVTGTDLSDEVLARARKRSPEVRFVAGDFLRLDFGTDTFDVLVALEVLSHVEDQESFVRKLYRHLRPGGYLMLATQNRYVLENFNNIPPPAAGQVRHWVNREELNELLKQHFHVLELFSVTPKANRGLLRFVNSHKLNLPVRALVGNRIERFKETLGLGWTLMALARKPFPG